MSDAFSIDILEKRWLPGMLEERDLCAHGVVRVRAGDTVLEEELEAFFQAGKPKRPETTCAMNQLWYPLFWAEWRKWRSAL